MKASLERGLRVAQDFSSTITGIFQTSVEAIGAAFGINKHSVDVFSESFVRSHLMF